MWAFAWPSCAFGSRVRAMASLINAQVHIFALLKSAHVSFFIVEQLTDFNKFVL